MRVSVTLLLFSRDSERVKGAGYFEPLRKDEKLDAVMSGSKSLLEMPFFVKKLLAMVTRTLTGDNVWASLMESLHTKTAAEERALVVARDEYRVRWHDAWEAEGLDFVLAVPHPMPAIPTGTAEKVTLISAAMGMICNIVRTAIRFRRLVRLTMCNRSTTLPGFFR